MAKSNKQKNIVAIGLSGAVGGVVAALADVVQRGKASAIVKIADTMTDALNIAFPVLGVIFLLVGLAVALCCIFEPETKVKAFFVGAGILSIIMTFVPYELPLSLLASRRNDTVVESPREGSLSYNFFRPALCFAQPPDETRQLVRVHIQLITNDKRPISEAIVTLQDSQSGKVIASSKFTSSHFHFYQPAGDSIIVVEVPGYRIARLKMSLQAGQEEESLVILLKSTWIPLSLQRLLR